LERKATSGIILMLLLTSMLTLVFNIQLIKASETIYIRKNGKVEPDTAPILRDKNLYTFTDNINDSIVVERDYIVIDGAGYTLQGTGTALSKGIDISERSNITIKNIKIKTFYYGIYLSGSSNNIIQGNTLTNNSNGIWLHASSKYNSIYGNNITTSKNFGILLGLSSNNSISDNSITDSYFGIGLDWSSNNTLRDNSLTKNQYSFRIWGGTISNFVNDIDVSNTVDGKLIYYWINKRDMTAPIDAGYVALINCTRITVQNLNFSNDGQGLLLAHTTNSIITKNSIANNQYGIHLIFSSNNVISENNVTYNTRGVFLDYDSNNNSITGNNMTNNEHGIGFYASSNNKFYHNHFINNTQQVNIRWDSYDNIWDDDYPSGGNYWSDYTGVDDDGDGIGDTPYVIDSDNTDRYPFMSSYIIPEDTTLPTISILSPENKTYQVNHVPLTFTVSESTSWIGYSLDGQMNVTITENTTLSELLGGSHSLIVYANNTAGKIGYSNSVYFSIETQQAESFPMWIVVAIAIIAGIGVILVVYFAHERMGLRLRPFFVLRYAFARDMCTI